MAGLLPEEHFPAGKPAVYKSCLLCPMCSRSCKRWQSKRPTNPDRFFFKCPVPESDHKYFKWADEVRPHEFTQVPYCRGCYAGVCRVQKETRGPNAGRIMFLCTVKEGQGSCGFRVWKDELERLQEEERTNPFQSAMVNCHNTVIAVKDMEQESKQMVDEGTDPNSPFDEIPDDVICRELILSQTTDHGEFSFNLEQEMILENETPSNELVIHKAVARSVMSKSISNAFHQAAEHLQNDLLARLETMDAKDHEAMSEAAEATYAALDYLLVDYKDLKRRAEELIHCARQLVESDRTMLTNAEREEPDKINSVHAKTAGGEIKNKNRIEALQEEVFDIAAEVSCCEVEMRSLELQLNKICKEKEVMEGKYLITSKKLEKSQQLLDQEEAEQNAAKAAFRRARTTLRG